ncbi:hypothetical protein [Acidimangrovimonas sediminis]|uniref:hypothetical protein n=1 Tax=Acidimangrovimonas sediminis TaxID=2056283 RepID=UPI000C7FC17C|nr:hypothetical protein [Acidimangrovimonas sediminis]
MADAIHFDADLHEFLTEAVELNFLDTRENAEEIAVAMLVVSKGYGALTEHQQDLFLHSVIPAMKASVGGQRVSEKLLWLDT